MVASLLSVESLSKSAWDSSSSCFSSATSSSMSCFISSMIAMIPAPCFDRSGPRTPWTSPASSPTRRSRLSSSLSWALSARRVCTKDNPSIPSMLPSSSFFGAAAEDCCTRAASGPKAFPSTSFAFSMMAMAAFCSAVCFVKTAFSFSRWMVASFIARSMAVFSSLVFSVWAMESLQKSRCLSSSSCAAPSCVCMSATSFTTGARSGFLPAAVALAATCTKLAGRALDEGDGVGDGLPDAGGGIRVLLSRGARLDEGRARERLLEEIKRVVVVEDLDGRADGLELDLPALRRRVVLRRLVGAALLQVHEAVGVSLERVLRLDELHLRLGSGVGICRVLLLHRVLLLLRRGDLEVLRRDELVELGDGLLLVLDHLLQVPLEVLHHLLQNTDDGVGAAPAARRVRGLEERRDLLLVHRPPHQRSQRAEEDLLLLEAHALLKRRKGFVNSRDAVLGFCRLFRELRRLLFSDARLLLDTLLVLGNLRLQLLELRVNLRIRAGESLDLASELADELCAVVDLLGGSRNVIIAETHELLVHLL